MDNPVTIIFRLLAQLLNAPGFRLDSSNPVTDGPNLTGGLNQIMVVINEFAQSDAVFWSKIFLVVITVILLIALILLIDKIQQLRKPIKRQSQQEQTLEVVLRNYNEEWRQVLSYVNSLTDSEWKLAVIEADNIFDGALKYMAIPGETMGERLMALSAEQVPSLNLVWDAHKLRNTIVHDLNISLEQGRAQAAVRAFQSGLRDLGLLTEF